MSDPAVYTHLESYLLYQSILAKGIDGGTFARISDELRNNGLVKGDVTYSSVRLSPEALQQQFFRLFGEELRGETETATTTTTTGDATTSATPAPTSPTSKKRKLAGPPLPTLKDVAENLQKVSTLADRLFKRYQADIVRRIKEDEHNYDQVQKALHVIEKNEKQRLAAKNNAQNGAPVAAPTLAPREIKPVAGPSTSGPVSTPTPPPGGKRPTSTTPIVPPKPPTPNIAPPAHFPQGAPQVVRPPSTGVPANGGAPVLQPPTGVTQPPPSGVLQPPVQPPKVPISPRPEANAQAKPNTNTTPQTATGPGQMQLKWDNPYQPPISSQPPPSRQYQSPGPSKTPIPPQQQRPQQVPQQVPQHVSQQAQQQWQNQQVQNAQGVQPPAVPTPSTNAQPTGKPLMVPPQHAGNIGPPPVPAGHMVPSQNAAHMVPQQPSHIARPPAGASPSPQPRPSTNSPAPPPTQHRPIQPHQGQTPQQHRPIAASPTPPPGATSVIAPPQRWPPPPLQKPQQDQAQPAMPPGTPTPASTQKTVGPYGNQQPRPPLPEHMIRQAVTGTPLAPRRSSSVPQTPVQSTPQSILRGLMTAWGAQATPSTPGGGAVMGDVPSPRYESLSPPPKPAALPQSTPTVPKKPATRATPVTEGKPSASKGPGRGRPPRSSIRGRRPSATPSAGLSATRRSQSIISQTDELSMDHVQTTTEVKNEEATPRPHEETGDTTADESVSGRGNVTTPGSMRILKRKRPETPAEPPGPPTHVTWTRGFTKVSSSALDQISSHRDANMFATGVRERDAPNYRQIVLQPQDITSIRSAIKQGNKAAVAAANSLPGGDPGTASVMLPISEDLVPPKGIVNSAQLERELVHMFCNAIMYNPDPYRGPGQSFMKRSQDDEEEAFGYQFDENGVVRNTQTMFLEVEKLLGDLRSAEKDRTARPLSTPRLTSTAATPADDTADDEDELAGDGGEGSGQFKRRRVRG